MTPGISGRTSRPPFACYDPTTSSWRTWPDISPSGSAPYSGTWPKSGMMRAGFASPLPEWVPLTAVRGSSSTPLLPSPDAAQGTRGGSQHPADRPIDSSHTGGPNLSDVAEHLLLPTPESKSSTSGSDYAREMREGSGGDDLETAVFRNIVLPTPTTGRGGYNSDGDPSLRNVDALLPTPTPTDMGERKTVEEYDEWQVRMAERHGTGGHGRSLDVEARRLLPTPVQPLGGRKTRGNERSDELLLDGVATELFPTPRATDGTNGGPGQRGSAGDLALPSAALELMPTPDASAGGSGGRSGDPDRRRDQGRTVTINDVAQSISAWGAYEPAIRRWEAVLGREAPWATEPSPRSKKGRLSPRFVEWMMGWAAGWVTSLGLSRNQQLKILGNGVVPQQAAAAARFLLSEPSAHARKRYIAPARRRPSPRAMMKAARGGAA